MNKLKNVSGDIADINLPKKFVAIISGKAIKAEHVPIASRTCGWLEAYLQFSRPKLCLLSSGVALFVDDKGKRYRQTQLSDLAKKYILKAGFDVKGACNVFRHSAATHMLENGANLRELQEYLGHEDIYTMQIYLPVTQIQLKKTYVKIHPAAMYPCRSSKVQIDHYLN